MKKNRNFFSTIIISLFIIAFAFSMLTAFFNPVISFIELMITAVAFCLFIVFSKLVRAEYFSALRKAGAKLSQSDKDALEAFPIPLCITCSSGEIIWYNSLFLVNVLSGENLLGSIYSESFKEDEGAVHYKDKIFTIYSSQIENSKENLNIQYFVDNTDLKKSAELYTLRRPSVIHILVDNYDELINSATGAEKNFMASKIESILEKCFVNECKGYFAKIEKDRFVAVIDSEHLETLIKEKFNFIEKIHKTAATSYMSATLSIGIGKDAENLSKSSQHAKQALDMALGRGGDQVAVKSPHGFEFFGGLTKGVEKSAKARSRMIASAISELVPECENIVLMGHKMADFDCIGAAVGLYKAFLQTEKPVHICLDVVNNLSKPLVSYLCKSGYENTFVSPEEAPKIVNRNTLLIIVDTHNPEIVQCKELLDLTDNVVVIDHHRKMVNYIDKAVIFYHEPNASSASEMVTEIVQYMSDGPVISRVEAEALLAGIMLDTKNFILKSSARTFEAAAYLKKLGADLVKVNGWFANSIETYHQRAKLISSAEIIHGCAFSYQDEFNNELLLAVPQTADELLHISEVSASFVMYLRDGVVSVSARSFGDMNVQLIMEKLGGGGHLTMAGAQIPAKSCKEVKSMLIVAIEEYLKENKIQ